MKTALVKVETRQVEARPGIFGATLIERFAKFAGVSESSRATYEKCLRQLFKHFSANSITEPSRENLVDWMEGMKAAGKSASTIQLYLSAAKLFFRWLAQEGMYANIADHLKSGVKPSHGHKKDALSTEQCAALVRNVKGDSVKELRDKAIISLMVTAGLRTIEVVRANVGDVRFERGKTFLYVQGKGRADRDEKVLLSKQAHKAIAVYLRARGNAAATEPLFTSTARRNKNERLETQSISRLVKSNLRDIGLDSPRLTAHSLRHSVATNLIFAGLELPMVQMILRHKNISTTMIYAAAWERYQNDGEQLLADKIFAGQKE